MNIVEPILFQARYQPEAPALCAQGIDVVSYSRLVTQMNNIARRAMGHGLKRGDVVLLSINNQPLLHAAVILGLTLVGIVPVSTAGNEPPTGLKVDAVIANTAYPFAQHVPHLALDYSWIAGDGPRVDAAAKAAEDGSKTARIVLTTGSTGAPRAVALSHQLLAARIARFAYLMGNRVPHLSRVYTSIGLTSGVGYRFLIYVLSRGGTLFFRGESPDNTLRAFEIFRIQCMLATTATLNQFLDLCDRHPSIDVHLDTIVSGASYTPPALLERARPRLCAHLITGYGSTETARCASAPAHRIAHIPRAVGFVAPGARIEIVDEADQPLPAGREGIVRIASQYGVDSYVDDPVESAKVFRNGWFYPGDLGALTADNLLIISGRTNDVLNAGGGKICAEAIEAALLAFKGVKEAAVFMATSKRGVEEVWAGIVCGEKIDVEKLRAHCHAQVPAVFVPVHVVTLDALPLGATGKVDRPRLKETILARAAS